MQRRPKLETLNGPTGAVELTGSDLGGDGSTIYVIAICGILLGLFEATGKLGLTDSVAIAKLCYAVKRLLEAGEPMEAIVRWLTYFLGHRGCHATA